MLLSPLELADALYISYFQTAGYYYILLHSRVDFLHFEMLPSLSR